MLNLRYIDYGTLVAGMGLDKGENYYMQQILDSRVGAVLEHAWALSCVATRRRLNAVADRAATEGLLWVAARLTAGLLTSATRVVWASPPAALP